MQKREVSGSIGIQLTSELPNERKLTVLGPGIEREEWKGMVSSGCTAQSVLVTLKLMARVGLFHLGSLLRSSGDKCQVWGQVRFDRTDRKAGLALRGFWMGMENRSQTLQTPSSLTELVDRFHLRCWGDDYRLRRGWGRPVTPHTGTQGVAAGKGKGKGWLVGTRGV